MIPIFDNSKVHQGFMHKQQVSWLLSAICQNARTMLEFFSEFSHSPQSSTAQHLRICQVHTTPCSARRPNSDIVWSSSCQTLSVASNHVSYSNQFSLDYWATRVSTTFRGMGFSVLTRRLKAHLLPE